MRINNLLAQQKMSKYRLSKTSGVPYATVSDICSGKARMEKCSAETLYRLAKALGVHPGHGKFADMEFFVEEVKKVHSYWQGH